MLSMRVFEDEDKIFIIGQPSSYTKQMIPQMPWQDVYIRMVDSTIAADATSDFIFSTIPFTERYIRSSMVDKKAAQRSAMSSFPDFMNLIKNMNPEDPEEEDTPAENTEETQEDFSMIEGLPAYPESRYTKKKKARLKKRATAKLKKK